MKPWMSGPKNKQLFVTIGVIVLFFALYFTQFRPDPSHKNPSIPSLSLAKISFQQNDVRIQLADSNSEWQKVKENQAIEAGDSITTGTESNAVVTFRKGGTLSVGQNSSAALFKLENQNRLELKSGYFTLKMQEPFAATFEGQTVFFDEQDSEIQVFPGRDNLARIRLLKGKASVWTDVNPSVSLEIGKIVSLADLWPHSIAAEGHATSPDFLVPVPRPITKVIPYTWKLRDFYSEDQLILREKSDAPLNIDTKVVVQWNNLDADQFGKKGFVELSRSSEMAKPQSFHSETDNFEFSRVHPGKNFWRVSRDQKKWSGTQDFEVSPAFTKDPAPQIVDFPSQVLLFDARASISVSLKVPAQTLGFVVEASTIESFERELTRTFWSPHKIVRLSFYKPGVYFYRFRAVNKNQEITAWSKIQTVQVETPPLLSRPEFSKNLTDGTLEGTIEHQFNLEWGAVPGAKQYRTIVTNDHGVEIKNFVTASARLSLSPAHSGTFFVAVQAVDEYDRLGQPSAAVTLHVIEDRKIIQLFLATKPTEMQGSETPHPRKPAAVETVSTFKLDQFLTKFSNWKFSQSKITLETAAFTNQSSTQALSNREVPVATAVGIRTKNWWQNSGVEASVKAGVVGVNSAGSALAPKQLEARYHYRVLMNVSSALVRQVQVSLFTGYEMYRSSGEGGFSTKYDLIKFGTSIEFPLGDRVVTGGEFAFGYGLDKSIKKEISGNLNIYLSKDFSFGGGYRLHLFDAGSVESSAGFLPYREGYTELFSTLNFHY